MGLKTKIQLARPDLDESDIAAVTAILRTPDLSLGPVGRKFEDAVARYAGARHAISVNSGTAGLHLCMIAANVSEGDEVVTPPFSFVASANCILFNGGVPRFADIDPETWDMDPAAAEAAIGPKTRAILPIHVFGRPCRIADFRDMAARRGLSLVEDSCESLGSTVDGKMTGTFGDTGVFAFYPNKQITTGEGGVIVTDDESTASLCRSLRNQGRAEGGGWLEHERLGYNYRLSDIQAALGISQLARIESFIESRQRVLDLYRDALGDFDSVRLPADPRPGERISWFVYVIRLADEFSRQDRDAVLENLRAQGVGCRNYFAPIHLQPYMQERFGFRKGQFPVTEAVAARTIALPFHNELAEPEIEYVANALRSAIDRAVAGQG